MTKPQLPNLQICKSASLVHKLVFVVLAQPISTHCTIASDVVAKVDGKEAAGKAKAKAGQGDTRA